MPDVAIKPMITASAPAANAALNGPSAVPPANGPVKSDSGQAEGSEGTTAEATTSFANALQKQMDRTTKSDPDNAQSERTEGAPAQAAPDAAAIATPAPDLTSLLAGLLPSTAQTVATPQAPLVPTEQAEAANTPSIQLASAGSRIGPALAEIQNGATLIPHAPATDAHAAQIALVSGKGADQDRGAAEAAATAAFDRVAAETATPVGGDAQPLRGPAFADTQPGYVSLSGEMRGPHSAMTGESATPKVDATSLRVDTAMSAPGWRDEIGQKVTWLVGRSEQRAELVLTPPHLGRVEVTVSVSNDQANALFVSANPAVRDALEQALPRLREVLADAGITLGQANVNAESSHGKHNGETSQRHANVADSELPGVARQEPAWVRRAVGLVDTFA